MFANFLASDTVKKVLFMLAVLAGGLQQILPPEHVGFQAASVLLAILAGLGIVSGGVKATQPKTVVQAPEDPKLPPAA